MPRSPALLTGQAPAVRSLHPATGEWPPLATTGEKPTQQQTPRAAKINNKSFHFCLINLLIE